MSPQRPLSAIVESTARFLEETAPAFPPAPVDVPLEQVSNLSLVALRIGLSLGPLGPDERALMARVDAEIAKRHATSPELEPDDDQVVDDVPVAALPELPLTHSLTLVARPFSQLARRTYRLGLEVPRGYNAFLTASPYYRANRRQPAQWSSAFIVIRGHQRRAKRARARRAALTVTRLPPMLYDRAQVA